MLRWPLWPLAFSWFCPSLGLSGPSIGPVSLATFPEAPLCIASTPRPTPTGSETLQQEVAFTPGLSDPKVHALSAWSHCLLGVLRCCFLLVPPLGLLPPSTASFWRRLIPPRAWQELPVGMVMTRLKNSS